MLVSFSFIIVKTVWHIVYSFLYIYLHIQTSCILSAECPFSPYRGLTKPVASVRPSTPSCSSAPTLTLVGVSEAMTDCRKRFRKALRRRKPSIPSMAEPSTRKSRSTEQSNERAGAGGGGSQASQTEKLSLNKIEKKITFEITLFYSKSGIQIVSLFIVLFCCVYIVRNFVSLFCMKR